MDRVYSLDLGDKIIVGTGDKFVQVKKNFAEREGIMKADLYGRRISCIIRAATPGEREIYNALCLKRKLHLLPVSPSEKYYLLQ